MGDIGGNSKHIVQQSHGVKIKNIQILIQEKKSRIVRLKQDIEDLKHAAIIQKEAEIEMLELDLAELNKRLTTVAPTDAEVIDV